jgi:hypothetical protein
MTKEKLLAWIVLGFFLSGCAGWSRRETVTAAAAATCGIIGGNVSGWVNHNNGHGLNEGKAIPAGVVGGALLCGGLAYLLTPEPPPPSTTSSSTSAATSSTDTEAKTGSSSASPTSTASSTRAEGGTNNYFG